MLTIIFQSRNYPIEKPNLNANRINIYASHARLIGLLAWQILIKRLAWKHAPLDWEQAAGRSLLRRDYNIQCDPDTRAIDKGMFASIQVYLYSDWGRKHWSQRT